MSIFPLLASLLGGNEAEAKQFFASEKGEVPKDIPVQFKKKELSDIFGKEPTSMSDLQAFYNQEIQKRLEENKKSDNPQSPGFIINNLDNELIGVGLNKVGVKNLQDVVPKFLTSQDISEKDQEKYNQIWLQGKTPQQVKGYTMTTVPKPGVEPLGTGIGAIKYSKNKKDQEPQNQQLLNLPVQYAIPPDLDQLWPLSKVQIKESDPSESAQVMGHELIHALNYRQNPEFDRTQQDFTRKLEETDPSLLLEKLGFTKHFIPSKKGEEEVYTLPVRVGQMTHPEWFKRTKSKTSSK
jgi:hypothetical protein